MRNEAKLLRALGAQIKKARKASGLTQEQLSELCEFDPTYISLLERGLRNPPFLTVCKLAAELKITPKDLLENVG
jgi:transcriptional regulator with XRE-family HTH domain